MAGQQIDVGTNQIRNRVFVSYPSKVDCERRDNVLALGSSEAIRRLAFTVKGLSDREHGILSHLLWQSDDEAEIRKYAKEMNAATSAYDMGGDRHFMRKFSKADFHLFISPDSPIREFSIYATTPLRPGNDPGGAIVVEYLSGIFDLTTKRCVILSHSLRILQPHGEIHPPVISAPAVVSIMTASQKAAGGCLNSEDEMWWMDEARRYFDGASIVRLILAAGNAHAGKRAGIADLLVILTLEWDDRHASVSNYDAEAIISAIRNEIVTSTEMAPIVIGRCLDLRWQTLFAKDVELSSCWNGRPMRDLVADVLTSNGDSSSVDHCGVLSARHKIMNLVPRDLLERTIAAALERPNAHDIAQLLLSKKQKTKIGNFAAGALSASDESIVFDPLLLNVWSGDGPRCYDVGMGADDNRYLIVRLFRIADAPIVASGMLRTSASDGVWHSDTRQLRAAFASNVTKQRDRCGRLAEDNFGLVPPISSKLHALDRKAPYHLSDRTGKCGRRLN